MTGPPDFDRLVTAWLDERMQPHAPEDVLIGTLARTSRLHRRPAWRIPERWIPMRLSLALAVIPRAVLIVLTIALVTALAAVVVVASQPTRLPAPVGPARNGLLAYDSAGDIWVMEPDGSDRRQLTSGPDRDVSPVWSRDGMMIAFWSYPAASDESMFTAPDYAAEPASLIVIDADGSDARMVMDRLVTGSPFDEPAWAPEGSRIAVGHDEGDGSVIDIASLDGADPVRLDLGSAPRWSPDGTMIAYQSRTQPTTIMVASLDAGPPRSITSVAGAAGPMWSSDSRQLVYFGPSSGPHDIWVVNVDGRDEHAISTNSLDEYWPAWSPAGDRIAFSRVIDDSYNRPHFVVVDADGSGELVLLPDDDPEEGGTSPIWSPDGTLLIGGRWVGDQGVDMPGTCSPDTACDLELRLIDAAGNAPVASFMIPENVGIVSWQRLAD